MAPLHQHIKDCIQFLGEEHADVNRWMDEYFRALGPQHRKIRHHREGIEEAAALFGDKGRLAATIHVLRDCRHIPARSDYGLGLVDPLGLKKGWPVSAYVQYTEEDFRAVVTTEILGPSGSVLWSFINETALQPFLTSVSRLSPQDVVALMPRWTEAIAAKDRLAPLEPVTKIRTDAPEAVREYVDLVLKSQQGQGLKAVAADFTFAYIPVDQLLTPIVLVDHEYVEQLKPELQGTSDLDIAKFGLSMSSTLQLGTVMDPSMRSVTFISKSKAVGITPVQLTQTPLGTEVRFVVAPATGAIIVSHFQNRVIVRTGVHRAFLLAKLGVKDIPCILVQDESFPLWLGNTIYPAFVPSTIAMPRPPLLRDYLDESLSIEVPLRRTNKVIRISAEESILPME